MTRTEIHRARRLVDRAIRAVRLDLSGLRVLTEIGSGNFLFTPVIAAAAGAAEVFAWTKDTHYGDGSALVDQCRELLTCFALPANRVTFSVNEQPAAHIAAADIITNSGHLRPLDAGKLRHARRGIAVPLMYEKWELRQEDVDIDFCRQRGVRIAGTWEDHPDLRIFEFCESLMVKIALEAGFEINGNRIVVFSADRFGELAVRGFEKLQARSVVRTTSVEEIYRQAPDADFIFFCDYLNTTTLIGERDGLLDPARLAHLNPGLGLVHLAGDIDHDVVRRHGLALYPDKRGWPVRMTYTLSHLGMLPTILLQAAGLKVGALLVRNEASELAQVI